MEGSEPSGPTEQPPASSSPDLASNAPNTTHFPHGCHPNDFPLELKKEGSDWIAIFNPQVERALDVGLVHTLAHGSVVCCVRFSADGKFLATGCNRTTQIYDTKTGAKTCVLLDETYRLFGDMYIRSVCFSPDGKYLATAADDKHIRIWDIEKKCIRDVFDGHQEEIYSVEFSPNGRLVASGSTDKTVRVWDIVDGSSKVFTVNDPVSVNDNTGVTSVAFSPNGQFVASGSLDMAVRIWDVTTGTLIKRLEGHNEYVYSVAFTPDGMGLISGSLDKTLKHWDVSGLVNGDVKEKDTTDDGESVSEKSSQATKNYMGHTEYVLTAAISPDGRWVVSGSRDRCISFWDLSTATMHCMIAGHRNSVISVDASRVGNLVATGSGDRQARIWSYQTL